jgi:N-acylneuraminate cytidylyltransferase
MDVTAIIPARGGSKGVPGKNLRFVGGTTLVGRAVRACVTAASVSRVVVSTDSDEIANEALQAGASVIRRPADIAGDTATSESALIHVLDALNADGVPTGVVAFVQCTSPFIAPFDLDNAVDRVVSGEADVVFSAVETHEFLWRIGNSGAVGVNHDHSFRPRRQDREPHYRETGAFYVMRESGLRKAGYRFFGRIEPMVVASARAIEIDAEQDLLMANALAPINDVQAPVDVDALVMDFDGVHTDDRAYVDQDGTESVAVSRSDGMGIAQLRRLGIPMLILSTERNPVVTARARKLGVEVLQGVEDKAGTLQKWLAENGIDPAKTAYVGNDINDVPCLELVGWPVVVPEAHIEARMRARVILTRPGGRGAVRELCERVIASRRET